MAQFEPQMFQISRAAEYFDKTELEAQTGQPVRRFATVALKELVDNAIDACETAGVAPVVSIMIKITDEEVFLKVSDNGTGISQETIKKILDFNTRTSDKMVYRSPTRGAQGNALKTILGMPYALGSKKPIVIKSMGVRHRIRVRLDPANQLLIDHDPVGAEKVEGTEISMTLPAEGQSFTPVKMALGFHIFNPHATITVYKIYRENGRPRAIHEHWKPTVEFPGKWRKFLPTDFTSPWWYSEKDLERLIFSHIGEWRNGGKDSTLRNFVMQFRGLTGTQKAKALCGQFPDIKMVSDFQKGHEEKVKKVWMAMREMTSPPTSGVLGSAGEAHLRSCLKEWYPSMERFWYGRTQSKAEEVPYMLEMAFADILDKEEGQGFLFPGLNFSPSYEDFLQSEFFGSGKGRGKGILGFLKSFPRGGINVRGVDMIDGKAVVVHLVDPALRFLDRAKTRPSLGVKKEEDKMVKISDLMIST